MKDLATNALRALTDPGPFYKNRLLSVVDFWEKYDKPIQEYKAKVLYLMIHSKDNQSHLALKLLFLDLLLGTMEGNACPYQEMSEVLDCFLADQPIPCKGLHGKFGGAWDGAFCKAGQMLRLSVETIEQERSKFFQSL